MQTTYLVHSAAPRQAQTSTTAAGGAAVTVPVDVLDVELIPVSHPDAGAIKLTFVGAERVTAKARYVVGATVTIPWDVLTVVAPDPAGV